MRTYIVYLMDKIGMFDPVTDLLVTPIRFLTWRETDQFAPPGLPDALAKLHGNWLTGDWSIEALGKSFCSAEEERTVVKWLEYQRGDRESLGPHIHSNCYGLFGDPGVYWANVQNRLEVYNALVVDEDLITPERIAKVPNSVVFEGRQVKKWNADTNRPPRNFWTYITTALLGNYKQVQDERLGILDKRSHSLEPDGPRPTRPWPGPR